jgi:hypothetical protein
MSQQPLDYYRSRHQEVANRSRKTAVLIGIGAGVGTIVTFPALPFAVLSAGAGHGDYAAARLLFPIPMLMTLATGNSIGPASIVLAFTQFTIYGAVLGWSVAASPFRLFVSGVVITLVHTLAALACFRGAIPNFS